MPASDITIKGAREHNLQAVDLILPRNKLICLTGVSGSGKSSLAFDTLYAEGQRRYVESLSSFARHFLGQMPKPDVDFIGGLSPSISISQKSAGTNPRSTVGTITEIYDYLRVLYARVGTGHCHSCGNPITAQTREQIIQRILELGTETSLVVLAPLIRGQKGEHRDLLEDLVKQGFIRARVDGEIVRLSDDRQLDRQMRHHIEVVVDRLTIQDGIRSRLAEAVELALKLGKGNMIVQIDDEANSAATRETGKSKSRGKPNRPKRGKGRSGKGDDSPGTPHDVIFSADYACTHCGISFDPPSPQLFSFNSPQGMCLECDGLGEAYAFDLDLLIPNRSLSFQQGCFATVGKLKDLGRWKRCVYKGVAETIDRIHDLDPGTMMETSWEDLPEELRNYWVWGTGDQHITYTWRSGSSPRKYGGKFEGIVPDLLSRYASSNSKMQQRRLEGYMRTMLCPECHGQRLNAQARAVQIRSNHRDFADRGALSLPQVCELAVSDAAKFFTDLDLDSTRQVIAQEAMKEIGGRLGFLTNVGLDYLSLSRTAPTLSGGESQRIRLAGQIGCGLVGVLYILDEPSIGLHARDNDRLIATLQQLRDAGNTVVVVEHDEDTMLHADHIVDFGPGPGVRGGEVVAEGSVADVMRARKSVTGRFLSGKETIEIPAERRSQANDCQLRILGAQHNNLKNVDVEIPLGTLVCVTGVSGSGKSSLVNDILVERLRRDLNRGNGEPGEHREILGMEHLDKLIAIDQTPIGRTPRSNPATYIKVFDEIRKIFTQMPESKRRGFKPGRFSFNVEGGRCEACSGNGANRLEMDFLADVWMTCPVCDGQRFNRETLSVTFKGKTISDVLKMDIQEGMKLFENLAPIHSKLKTLHDVGLDYLQLGQPSPTLSGGEAQRVKLARELVKKSTGKTLYLLDEPTTGLHFADIKMLLKVLQDFVDAGNTVLVVEHNLDVMKVADWIIDLGPEGGAGGGQVIATGTPEQIAECDTHTGRAVATALKTHGVHGLDRRKTTRRKKATLATTIEVKRARQHNLKDVSASIRRDELTVFCGPSGSGKSSMAMDTIYAEGQRRYVESLSSYARQFVSQMQKPDVEHVEGLSPAIAIEQKNLSKSPRSTVGTTTEIYDYLRILMARMGEQYCPDCANPVGTQTADQVVDKLMQYKSGTRLYLMAPTKVDLGEEFDRVWDDLRASGFLRVRIDGVTFNLDQVPAIDRRRRHEIETVVDRVVIRANNRSRIAESVEQTLSLGEGVMHVAVADATVAEPHWHVVAHSQHLACDSCGRSFEPLTPHSFSFNSQLGWCPACEGLGVQTGANPAALIAGNQRTLRNGALLLWPNVARNVSAMMLDVLSSKTRIPLDVPFEQLAARERRILFHGTGDVWYDVMPGGRKKLRHPIFRFQFKGVYPALEEAARLSPALRSRLNHLVDEVECSACGGSRLRDDASATRLRDLTIDQICHMPIEKLAATLKKWKFNASERRVCGELVREIRSRTTFLNDVGLGYLTLSRTAASLSGGEAQRIRLASQLGSGLCGVLYVLDEPTIGLHPRDNERLLGALYGLRDLGNTLLLVEHDKEVIAGSDQVMDFGPMAGKHGGQIVASGSPAQLMKKRGSVTGPYLSGKKNIPVPSNRRYVGPPMDKPPTRRKKKKATKGTTKPSTAKTQTPNVDLSYPAPDWLVVRGARHHNLKGVDVHIPLARFTALTGPSGSGKSSLLEDVVYAELAKRLHRANTIPGGHDAIEGIEHINKVIRVDQQAIGNAPTSNPATYTGAFDLIRKLFSHLPASKIRGYTQRRFSFNAPGGRCEECDGNGQLCIEMHFLPDVWVTCDACNGARYNKETLEVLYHGRSIADVLDMTCGEAVVLFENIPKIRRIFQTLCDVGLDYLTLGQSAPTLSGGEAQRVKLASELSRPDTGRTLYLLDEPTTGLHFDDLSKLLDVLHRLVDLGNTVVVIEHNLDIIKSADWVIDIGPEAGAEGGHVVVTGTPETVSDYAVRFQPQKNGAAKKTSAKRKAKRPVKKKSVTKSVPAADSVVESGHRSYTGEALAPVVAAGPLVKRALYTPGEPVTKPDELKIEEVGAAASMPWQVDGRRWHTQDRVDRKGKPVQWDGRILSAVVDRIQDLGEFSETDWNSRSIVEIAAGKKSNGWFFHAITAETWTLKLKFRTAKNTFKVDELQERLPLTTLNEMDDLPVYGNAPRVHCKNLRGPLQEVEIRLHSWEETDRPEFWQIVDDCVAGFESYIQRRETAPEDHMPWKKMGERWHFSRKGFPPLKKPKWKVEVLEAIVELLSSKVDGTDPFLWNNQQVVRLFVPGTKEAWASILTKKPTHVELILSGPKGGIGFGRVANLGRDREMDGSREKVDRIHLMFKTIDDLQKGSLSDFLDEHLETLGGKQGAASGASDRG